MAENLGLLHMIVTKKIKNILETSYSCVFGPTWYNENMKSKDLTTSVS